MTFLYPFLTFLQPGILWPQLADARPLLVLSALALVVGVSRRADYARAAAFRHPVFICLLLFILAQGLSVYYSGVGAILGEWSYWSTYPIFVAISILLISNAAALRSYILGMLAGAMFVVCYGILAVFLVWPSAVGGRAGAYGMYENHNDYSFIIIQILPFLYLYFRTERGLLLRGLLGVSMLGCVLGIVMSLSRGGMLALVLEALLIVLLGMQGRRRLLLLPPLILAGAVAIGYQWILRAENQGDHYTAEQAQGSRFELWRAGKAMVSAHPLFGVGSRRFGEFAKLYGELSHDQLGKNSHNTYVEVLAGSGILGFVPFMLMLYYLVRELRRRPMKTGPPPIDATRIATLIALYTIMFRALLDAKAHDWSFYVFCAVGLACAVLQRGADSSARAPAASGPGGSGASAAQQAAGAARQG